MVWYEARGCVATWDEVLELRCGYGMRIRVGSC